MAKILLLAGTKEYLATFDDSKVFEGEEARLLAKGTFEVVSLPALTVNQVNDQINAVLPERLDNNPAAWRDKGDATWKKFQKPPNSMCIYKLNKFISSFSNITENNTKLTTTYKSITQYGITWTFDKEYEGGQFVNGDYWVLGPVKIISIDPPSIPTDGVTNITGFTPGQGTGWNIRTRNGSMINPVVTGEGSGAAILNGANQAYDSEMYKWEPSARSAWSSSRYQDALNVAKNVSSTSPLTVANGSSLVSSKSYDRGYRPQLSDAAVLTVLATPPREGSFRPAYSGTDKEVKFHIGQVNKTLLSNLSISSVTASTFYTISDMVSKIKRPWLDHFGHWSDAAQHHVANNNQPNYGRDYSTLIGDAALIVNCNESEITARWGITKNDLLIGLIQIGIDVYGCLRNGAAWCSDGALNCGRKLPVLMAGVLLNDKNMKEVGTIRVNRDLPGTYYRQKLPFAEDCQTFYVDQIAIDYTHLSGWPNVSDGPEATNGTPVPYTAADIGLPQWGHSPDTTPQKDNKLWDSNYHAIAGVGWCGLALAARIMEAGSKVKTLWAWDAFFDHQDLYMKTEIKNGPERHGVYCRAQSRFSEGMWDKYRADYGNGYYALVNNVRQYGDCRTNGIVQ